MIVGPANCGKTFILMPLTKDDKYTWLRGEKAELVFLNDFWWSQETILGKELLLLLEGQTVHLSILKKHYTQDISINSDVPIVAVGKGPVQFVGKYNAQDEQENEMMAVRWKVYKFFSKIAAHKQKEIQPCPKCFFDLVLMAEL